MTRRPAPVLMVQGTASHAGKSTLVTALCRILRQDGYRVAPFKSQNMALNSYVAAEGGEIGRAQAVQAEAAGLDPSIDMNPILLKPEGDARSQVIVNGRATGSLAAGEYQKVKLGLWPHVTSALDRLRARYDVVVAEGAGSPAEINLRHADLANMRVARYADAPVLLVGDIDRGGVFASLLGTLLLLDPEERALVRGFAINKFRGDPAILAPGLDMLRERTGVPVLGVLPYLRDLDLPEEDSLGIDGRADPLGGPVGAAVEIAVARLPRIANFDDFAPLAAEPGVRVRYVERPADLDGAHLLVLPGTKTTIADLAWLRETGLADAVVARARAGTPVLGICGGFQMLGRRILDPEGAESREAVATGLGLLPVETTFAVEKRTVRVEGELVAARGPFAGARGAPVRGYEIHMGRTDVRGALSPFVRLGGPPAERGAGGRGPASGGAGAHDDGPCSQAGGAHDGLLSEDGLIVGTYLHGLFDNDDLRRGLLDWLAARAGVARAGAGRAPSVRLAREAQYDALADAVRRALDVDALKRACGLV